MSPAIQKPLVSHMIGTCAAVLAAAWLAGCVTAEITVPDVMTVVAILPSHGAGDIDLDVQPLVYFSHTAFDAGTVERGLTLECVGSADPTVGCAAPDSTGCGTTQVATTVTYDGSTQVARLVPDTPLAGGTCYVLVVAAGIDTTEPEVGPLPVEVRSSFRTR